MGETDLFEWTPDEIAPSLGPDYRELGWALIDTKALSDFDQLDPLEKVVALVRAGDAGEEGMERQFYPGNHLFYALAIEAILDPRLQLELGCLMLQRAQSSEAPLCEHLYE